MILFDLLVIFVGSANVLWLPANRKRPAVVFLAVLAFMLLAANLMPDARQASAVKGAAIAIYLVGLIRFRYVLAGLSRREGEYDARLRSILQAIRRAHAVWARARNHPRGTNVAEARAGALRAYAAALRELGLLAPPDGAWAHTTDLLRAYVIAASERAKRTGEDAPGREPLSDAAFDAMIEELDRAWDRALRVPGAGSGP